MARTGKITLYEGVGKDSKKPFKCLRLEVGNWDALYFPQSKFEMEYLEKYLTAPQESVDTSGAVSADDVDIEDVL